MDQKNTALLGATTPVPQTLNGKNGTSAYPAAPSISFTLNGTPVVLRSGRNDSPKPRSSLGVEIPTLVLHGRHAARWQLPHLHGGDQGRTRASAVLLPLSQIRDGSHHQQRAGADQPENVDRAAALGRS